jgi:hypothetical protein
MAAVRSLSLARSNVGRSLASPSGMAMIRTPFIGNALTSTTRATAIPMTIPMTSPTMTNMLPSSSTTNGVRQMSSYDPSLPIFSQWSLFRQTASMSFDPFNLLMDLFFDGFDHSNYNSTNRCCCWVHTTKSDVKAKWSWPIVLSCCQTWWTIVHFWLVASFCSS